MAKINLKSAPGLATISFGCLMVSILLFVLFIFAEIWPFAFVPFFLLLFSIISAIRSLVLVKQEKAANPDHLKLKSLKKAFILSIVVLVFTAVAIVTGIVLLFMIFKGLGVYH
jgi:prepilin signal peptidase PulO-like enzyme (type II secretory pathway)